MTQKRNDPAHEGEAETVLRSGERLDLTENRATEQAKAGFGPSEFEAWSREFTKRHGVSIHHARVLMTALRGEVY